MAEEEIGEFYWHEALDRTSIAHDFVDDCVCEHEAVQSRPELQALAQKAVDALAELYQKIGAIRFAETDNGK